MQQRPIDPLTAPDQIRAALDGLMRGRTTVVIAHRLATVRRAQKIAVLERGRVTALGTHAELLRASPTYAHLAEIQLDVPEEGGPAGAAGGSGPPVAARAERGRERVTAEGDG